MMIMRSETRDDLRTRPTKRRRRRLGRPSPSVRLAAALALCLSGRSAALPEVADAQRSQPRPRRLRGVPLLAAAASSPDARLLQTEEGRASVQYLPDHDRYACVWGIDYEPWQSGQLSPTLEGCCSYFAWHYEGCMKRPPKESELMMYEFQQASASTAPTFQYHSSPDDDTCRNDRPLRTGEKGYKTLKKCCGKNFPSVRECVTKGESILARSEGEAADDPAYFKYLPIWGVNKCTNDRKTFAWEGGFDTLEECCGANFNWSPAKDDCLGIVPDDEGEDGGDDGETDEDETVEDGEYVDNTNGEVWWRPLPRRGHCVTSLSDPPPPAHMLHDPDRYMTKTYQSCCRDNFDGEPGEYSTCVSYSEAMSPPTDPPSRPTNVVVEISLEDYWYPSYNDGVCRLDGRSAPSFMSLSHVNCCKSQFATGRKKCVRESGPAYPSAGGKDDDGGDGGGSATTTSTAVPVTTVQPALYRYHYFAHYGLTACVQNTLLEAPDYTYEAPADFLFLTMEDCCLETWYEEDEYGTCLEHSRHYALGLAYNQWHGSFDVDSVGHHLEVVFEGKLYFRNVFLPSKTASNMKVVRDAVLNGLRVNMKRSLDEGGDGGFVSHLAGKTFDGVGLTDLEDAMTRRSLLLDGSEEKFEEIEVVHPDREERGRRRKLQRMQLFRFDMTISVPCDDRCLSDPATTGRSASFDLVDHFDGLLEDGSIMRTIKSDMESMGLVGPFYTASLPEGRLQFASASLDGMFTDAPTVTTSPSESPSMVPSTAEPTREVVEDVVVCKYYPHFKTGTCVNDCMQGEFQQNLYASLAECCRFPWLDEDTCLDRGETDAPTVRPSANPTTSSPTVRPSDKPTREPTSPPTTRNPTTRPTDLAAQVEEFPTFSPSMITDSPTDPIPPTRSPTLPPTTNFVESFESGNMPLFTTNRNNMAWTLTDRQSTDGTYSIRNAITGKGQRSKLVLEHDFGEGGILRWDQRVDVQMPWNMLAVRLDGTTKIGIAGGNGNPTWKTQDLGIGPGKHMVEWEVRTADSPLPPDPPVTGFVYIDNVRFFDGGTAPPPETPPPTPKPTPKPSPPPVEELTATPTDGPSAPPTASPASEAVPSEDVGEFAESFESGDIASSVFSTSDVLPWTVDAQIKSDGEFSATNSPTERGQSSKMTMVREFPSQGVLHFDLRSDVFMPWAMFLVRIDGDMKESVTGHAGEVQWGGRTVDVPSGQHTIEFEVKTIDSPMPPNPRGSGKVWVDNVRFHESVIYDFDDGEISDDFETGGVGRWRVDDNQPSGGTGLAVRSQKGLLPGESCSLFYTAEVGESGSVVSFNVFLGMGTFSFLVDDTVKDRIGMPGAGVRRVSILLPPGQHALEWKYEAPFAANMPLSAVWVDNISFDVVGFVKN